MVSLDVMVPVLAMTCGKFVSMQSLFGSSTFQFVCC